MILQCRIAFAVSGMRCQARLVVGTNAAVCGSVGDNFCELTTGSWR